MREIPANQITPGYDAVWFTSMELIIHSNALSSCSARIVPFGTLIFQKEKS